MIEQLVIQLMVQTRREASRRCLAHGGQELEQGDTAKASEKSWGDQQQLEMPPRGLIKRYYRNAGLGWTLHKS